MQKLLKSLFFAIFFTIPSISQASVIDFEELSNPDELRGLGPSYSSQGFIFSYTPAPGEPYPTSLQIVGTAWRYNTGTTSIHANSPGALTTLKREDQQGFSLQAIDLAELNGPGATSVTFAGMTISGQTVIQQFFLDGLIGFEHFVFSGDFTNLSEVTWKPGDFLPSLPYMYDNVDVAANAVPLPGTLFLVFTGLAILSHQRKRG